MNKLESKYFNTAKKMDLALLELLKKKSFEYITVTELCKYAKVNRSTFYLHYENLGDLLDETARYLIDNFISYFQENKDLVFPSITDCNLEDLVFINEKYLTPYLSFVKDNKEVFSTALSHVKVFGFEGVYKKLFKNIFNPILARFDYPNEYRQYVMMYYLNGITAITTEWLKNDCKAPTKEISEIIFICIFGKQKI